MFTSSENLRLLFLNMVQPVWKFSSHLKMVTFEMKAVLGMT